MIPGLANRRHFSDLTEPEIVALAISSEEDDARIYASYAERLRAEYPASAAVFDAMADEENVHRRRLIEMFEARFGKVIPLIRREHVAGYYSRRPVWLIENLGLDRIRQEVARMEEDSASFYTPCRQDLDRPADPQAARRPRRRGAWPRTQGRGARARPSRRRFQARGG